MITEYREVFTGSGGTEISAKAVLNFAINLQERSYEGKDNDYKIIQDTTSLYFDSNGEFIGFSYEENPTLPDNAVIELECIFDSRKYGTMNLETLDAYMFQGTKIVDKKYVEFIEPQYFLLIAGTNSLQDILLERKTTKFIDNDKIRSIPNHLLHYHVPFVAEALKLSCALLGQRSYNTYIPNPIPSVRDYILARLSIESVSVIDDSAKQTILNTLEDDFFGFNLTILGHSLGGAIANIFFHHLYVVYNNHINMDLFSFAPPRYQISGIVPDNDGPDKTLPKGNAKISFITIANPYDSVPYYCPNISSLVNFLNISQIIKTYTTEDIKEDTSMSVQEKLVFISPGDNAVYDTLRSLLINGDIPTGVIAPTTVKTGFFGFFFTPFHNCLAYARFIAGMTEDDAKILLCYADGDCTLEHPSTSGATDINLSRLLSTYGSITLEEAIFLIRKSGSHGSIRFKLEHPKN